MSRACLALLILLTPVLVLLTVPGCSQNKKTVVQDKQERHETEPQMVSPGEEVIE